MSGILADVVALALLAAVLVFAMAQPRGLPEVTVAVPAAAVAVGLGLVSPAAALGEVRALGPTVGFLAAILVLAHLADAEGVFAGWASAWRGPRAGGHSDCSVWCSPPSANASGFKSAGLRTHALIGSPVPSVRRGGPP